MDAIAGAVQGGLRMNIKPILFNTEMVKALLSGIKTCTRRKIPIDIVDFCDIDHDGELLSYQNSYGDFINPEKLCRYQSGDILYVRETWCKGSYGNEKEKYYYKADDNNFFCTWHPSIHMPKEAARIWLKVTNVRVERLQDIDIDGIRNEGLSSTAVHVGDMSIALKEWALLWNSIVKKSDIDTYGWDANPYVWVIEFERCEKQ